MRSLWVVIEATHDDTRLYWEVVIAEQGGRCGTPAMWLTKSAIEIVRRFGARTRVNRVADTGPSQVEARLHAVYPLGFGSGPSLRSFPGTRPLVRR